MEKIILFNNNDGKTDYCKGNKYRDFIDYAFHRTDFFMLVYINYFGEGYSLKQKFFKRILSPFEVKTRTNPSWPGTLWQEAKNTSYRIVFYKNHKAAKIILKLVHAMSSWGDYGMPADLAFFKGNTCWFYSVGHEKIAAIIHATNEDLDFVESHSLALKKNAKPTGAYYSAYDEPFLDTALEK